MYAYVYFVETPPPLVGTERPAGGDSSQGDVGQNHVESDGSCSQLCNTADCRQGQGEKLHTHYGFLVKDETQSTKSIMLLPALRQMYSQTSALSIQ